VLYVKDKDRHNMRNVQLEKQFMLHHKRFVQRYLLEIWNDTNNLIGVSIYCAKKIK
jgi:hypothetical protein